MRIGGVGNQSSMQPLEPYKKPEGLKDRVMNFISGVMEKLGASKNESPVLEITRNETKATATPPQADQATQRTSFVAKQALPASVKKEEDEGETFVMQYDGKTRILNTSDTGSFKTTTSSGKTLQYQQLPKEPESIAARSPPKPTRAPRPPANLGKFEGTYQPPPAPPSAPPKPTPKPTTEQIAARNAARQENRKTTYGQLRSDDKIPPPPPVPRPTPEQIAARDAALAKKAGEMPPKPTRAPRPPANLGKFGGTYQPPPPPPTGVDPFKGG